MHRPTWILAVGLALLCAPAQAVPCRDDTYLRRGDGEASSIQLKPTQPGGRFYDASPIPIDELAPRLPKKDELPPSLRDDGRAHEWRKRTAARPAIPAQKPGSASLPIPDPTGLVLFGGMLLSGADVRRRRSLGAARRALRARWPARAFTGISMLLTNTGRFPK
jgi:hypothetical protein